MRIVLICEVFLPKVDGVVGRTLSLIRELRAAGDEVLVCCPAVPESRESPVPLVECRSFPCVSYPDYHIGVPGPDLLHGLREFAPDVVHFINPLAFGFAVCLQLRRAAFSVPVVFSFHTQYGEFVRTYPGLSWLSGILWHLMRAFHNTADVNLTVSQTMLEDLELRGFERMQLWPPAVDSERFSPSLRNALMRRRLTGHRPVQSLLLTVSRLAAEKNVGFLTEVLDRVPDGQLAVVGDGPERESLERRFAGRTAIFPGCLTGLQLSQAYASADVFVYASETETMGNVVLEAMAAGLPIVAAAAGGVCSLVQHGRTGFLYTPGRADEAAGCVRQLIENADLRESMSRAALEDARSRNWVCAVAAVRGSYRRACEVHAQQAERRPLSWLAAMMSRLLILGFSLCTLRRTSAALATAVRPRDAGEERFSGRTVIRPTEETQAAVGAGEHCAV